MPGSADGQRELMAYFSHSYRPVDNPVNLHFWEMFSERGLSFAVDPPSRGRRPMDVTYLEWLMAQSACFVAVIPRREDAPSPFCSPYQLFEYRLAVRAGMPRLIFLQDDLEARRLGIDPDDVMIFRRRDIKGFRGEHEERVRVFADRVKQQADPRPRGAQPIGLVTSSGDPAYGEEVVSRMQEVIESTLGRSSTVIDPARFDSDYRLLQAVGDCDVLVSEIRPPYVPADLYGLIHGRALPTLRIAHLAPGESPEDAGAAMRLAVRPGSLKTPAPEAPRGWPILLRGYQVDPSMQPVLFWNDPEDLCRRMAESLARIATERTVLGSPEVARQYFQRLGRLHGKVFISNFRAQNELAGSTAAALRKESLEVFHYTDVTRDPSRPNWKDEVRGELELCTQFIALIDEGFNSSPWCVWETEVAVDLFKQGQVELLTYKLGTDRIPQVFGKIAKHVQEIGPLPAEERVATVVRRAVESFERGRRVKLGESERSRIVEILSGQACLQAADGLAGELQAAGLPDSLCERARKAAGLGEVVDLLADHPTWIAPWKTALGLFLTSATRDARTADREFVWNLCRLQMLMPDVRLWIESRAVTRELGLGLEYGDSSGTVGRFTRVHQGRLEEWQPAAERTGGLPLPGLVDLVGGQPNWQSWVARIGESIASGPPFAAFQEEYRQAVGPAAEGEGLLGLCVASGAEGLRVPIEWATFDGLRAPLALRHPVRRYIWQVQTPRPPLRHLLTQGRPAPVRVLIVGTHAGDLPAVDEEIRAVGDLYARWFERMGWPASDLTVIGSGEAAPAQLEKRIRHGGYHLLHFAGHGLSEGSEPALAIADATAKKGFLALPASVLAGWVERSDLRLIYLSSCRGAGDAVEAEAAIRRFESLAEALVRAHVPEVVGFRWPILDRQSRTLAESFHESYLRDFDASAAMFNARGAVRTSAQIWAAAVVIAQHDSPGDATGD